MSVETAEDRRPSPLLSNNPFRNRTSPPSSQPTSATTNRPISKNPFLDTNEVTDAPPAAAVGNSSQMSPVKSVATDNTLELFQTLSVEDRAESPRRAPPPPTNGTHRRPENIPLRPFAKMAPSNHRPTLSDEDKRRRQMRSAKGPPGVGELDIFADPPDETRTRERRPARRNSESSVRDKSEKPETEEEKKRRERRAREKRHGKPKVDHRKLDVIDKLDVTSIYGMGLFHHDGPFDACNPHRNRKGSKQAPMQAFPKNSRNMQLGGSGPNNSRLNLEQIHGTGQEAHIDFNSSAVADDDAEYMRRVAPIRSASFNPVDRTEPVHGQESAGLGTSTFLEGAPASRSAIQRRESEIEAAPANGLSRKKSIVQKIRSVRPGGGRVTSPEPAMQTPTSPLGTAKSENTVNPFFQDYEGETQDRAKKLWVTKNWKDGGKSVVPGPYGNPSKKFVEEAGKSLDEERKSQEEERKTGRTRAPSSPKRGGLERKMTHESTGGGEGKSSGGFLSRVKSLKRSK